MKDVMKIKDEKKTKNDGMKVDNEIKDRIRKGMDEDEEEEEDEE